MVKHTYFSTELSILKHPVLTVINKRRKESNYRQELVFQSKQITTAKTSSKGRQARWIKVKIIKFQGTQEHSKLRPRHLVITVVLVPGFKELEPTTHLCLIQPLLSQMQLTRLQEQLAAYSVGRKIIATSLL